MNILLKNIIHLEIIDGKYTEILGKKNLNYYHMLN